ncbi:MAG TPA: hypothetical protein VK729_10310 [Silvibacterium sp.]|nr:hypothetical protein [Silvibacterium sp.]
MLLLAYGLGLYAIIEKIGSGGMGELYRALDTRLDREVALKLVSESDLSGDTPHIPPPLVEAVPCRSP